MAAPGLEESAAPDDGQDDLLSDQVSLFPVPSLEYFQTYFSDEALARRVSPTESLAEEDNGPVEGSSAKTKRLPTPPAIPDESFDSFGVPVTATDHLLRELETQGIPHLGADVRNPRILLKRLLWSCMGKFLELLDLMIKNPDAEKRQVIMDDLQNIMINFHHVVNQYRLPQAAQSFVELMKLQRKRNARQAVVLLDSLVEAVRLLQTAGKDLQSGIKQEEEEKVMVNGDGHGISSSWPLNGLTPELDRLLAQVEFLRTELEDKHLAGDGTKKET